MVRWQECVWLEHEVSPKNCGICKAHSSAYVLANSATSSRGDAVATENEEDAQLLLFLKGQLSESLEPDGRDISEQENSGTANSAAKKRRRGGRRSAQEDQITPEVLRQHFHMPIAQAASRLGVCMTLLKKICRRHNIRRWPSRQIQSIMRAIQSQEMASLNEAFPAEERLRCQIQIQRLQAALQQLMRDPSKAVILPDESAEGEDHALSIATAERQEFEAFASQADSESHPPLREPPNLKGATKQTRKRKSPVQANSATIDRSPIAQGTVHTTDPIFPGRTSVKCVSTVSDDRRPILTFTGPVILPPLELPTAVSPFHQMQVLEPPVVHRPHPLSVPSSLVRPVVFASNSTGSTGSTTSAPDTEIAVGRIVVDLQPLQH